MAAVPLTLETSLPTTANTESTVVITPLPQLKTEAIHYAERPSNLTLVEPQHSHNTPTSALSPASALTLGGGGGSISPALSSTGSLSPSFLPEMPQWKRDLIQRRKQNVQRTLSASSQSPSQSPSPSPSVATAAVTLSATSSNISGTGAALYGGLKKSTSLSSSVRSLAGSNTNIDQLAAADGLLQSQQQHSLTKDYTTLKVVNKQQYAAATTPNAITTNTTKPATINYIKSSSSSSSITSPLLTSPLCSSSSPLKEKAERLFGGQYTATTKEEIFIQTQQQQKYNFKKENHTEEMAENNIKTKEQEQEFIQAAAEEELEVEEAETYEMLKKTKEIQEEQQLNEEQINETATIIIKTSDITNKQQQLQQQTATRLTGSTCTTTHTSSSTLTSTSTSSSSSSLLLTKRTTAINNEYEREHLASHFSGSGGSGGGGGGINSHSHSITGTNVNIVNQLLTKCESERLVCAANTTITTTTVNNTNNSTTGYSNNYFNNLNNSSASATIGGNTGVNNNCSSSSSSSGSGVGNNSGGLNSVSVANVVKISQKLQENQFIKNEQQQLQQQQQQKKFLRYQKFNNTTTATTATAVGGGGVGVLDLKSPTRTFLTTSSSSTSLSLSSPTSSVTAAALGVGFNSNCAIKKKMVAVQEMKKSTQNSATHLHPISTTCNNSQQQQQQQQQQLNRALATNRGVIVGGGGGGIGGINNPATDLDTSEDLSYGPGIVSKLRCRYLSLALRESMEQQRLNKDHLRRSTSLNNLLDNTTEDDDDDDEEEEEEDLIDGELVAGNTEQSNENKDPLNHHHLQMNKKTSGILKSSLNNGQEKRFSSTTHNSQGSNGVGVTFTETTFTKRSRHLKRGNDSLKRARSVEALLSEKSPWQVRGNSSTNCGVSIEDKIQNARERLHQGTDHMPPKRLTSIIDDTERPPPDLVKQTLKKFEATANRRPRLNSRSNSKGDVASKVETFKNIEKKQKPVVNYPKPISPTKKLQKPLKTSTPQANDLLQSPLGRKVMATANAIGNNLSAANDAASTTPLKSGGSGNTLSEHTPDIIPRQTQTQQTKFTTNERDFKQNKELFACKEKAPVVDILKRGGEHNKEKTDVVGTPVTALTKEFSKFKISSKSDSFCSLGGSGSSSSVSSSSLNDNRESESVKDGGGGGGGGVGGSVDFNIGDACQRHNKYPYNNSNNDETTNQQQQQQQQELNINTLKNENDKIINNKTKQINNETSSSLLSSSPSSIAANATIEMKNEATTVKNYENLLVKTATASPPASSSDLSDGGNEYDIEDVEYGDNTETNATTKRITRTALDNIAKAGFSQQFKFNNSQQQQQQSTTISCSSSSSTSSPLNAGKQIGVIRPLLNTQTATTTKTSLDNNMETLNHTSTSTTSPLTSREIEKNRINDMKKSTSSSTSSSSPSSTSLDNVIKSSPVNASAGSAANTIQTGVGSSTGFSDVDTVISATNSPLWAMRKRRQTPPAAPAENTTMVFNFSNRKEVPDYIDNDGVIFRRKRELPKPNESGFVLLGDLSVETSTDMDYDDFSMCPPSPCDVEFINANIVIDGKSSIRQKSKETTHYRVQFNDTLNSTFEYPSAASLCMDDSFSAYNENYTQPHGSNPLMANDLSQAFQNLRLENKQHQQQQQQQQQQHHVADEIIQLPTLNASLPVAANNTSSPLNTSSMGGGSNTATPTKNILGNLPLGSAPLGFYTPLKAPIDRLFQLGVTRAPSLLSNESTATTTTTPTDASTNANAPATTNGGSRLFNGYGICDDDTGNGSIVGITDGLIKDHLNDDTNNKLKNKTIMNADYSEDCEEAESLQYIKPADDDLNIAYSEGTQKTDLLY